MAEHVRQASTLRISDQKTMELIELYQAQECLWNTTHQNYRNKLERKMAARRVAQELKVPGFRAHHVIAKFKNIRNAFSQELKKIEKTKNTRSPYVPKVFWFKKMSSFILPHLQKPRLLYSPVQPNTQPQTVYFLNGGEDWVQPTIAKEESRPYPMETDKSFPIISSSRSSSPSGPSKGTKSRSDHLIAQSLQEISGNLNAMTSKNDCFESFGKYIAALLRNLPPEKAWEVQPKIVSIITTAGLEKFGVRNNRDVDSNKKAKVPEYAATEIKIETVEDSECL